MKAETLGCGVHCDDWGADLGSDGGYEYLLSTGEYDSYIFRREELMSYEMWPIGSLWLRALCF